MSEPTIVTLLTEEEIRTWVGDLAAQIRADYVGKPLTIVAILTVVWYSWRTSSTVSICH